MHLAPKAGPRGLALQRQDRVQRVKINYDKLKELCLHATHADDDHSAVSREERSSYNLYLKLDTLKSGHLYCPKGVQIREVLHSYVHRYFNDTI